MAERQLRARRRHGPRCSASSRIIAISSVNCVPPTPSGWNPSPSRPARRAAALLCPPMWMGTRRGRLRMASGVVEFEELAVIARAVGLVVPQQPHHLDLFVGAATAAVERRRRTPRFPPSATPCRRRAAPGRPTTRRRSRPAWPTPPDGGWAAPAHRSPGPVASSAPARNASRSRGSGTGQSAGISTRPDASYGYTLAYRVISTVCSTTTIDSKPHASRCCAKSVIHTRVGGHPRDDRCDDGELQARARHRCCGGCLRGTADGSGPSAACTPVSATRPSVAAVRRSRRSSPSGSARRPGSTTRSSVPLLQRRAVGGRSRRGGSVLPHGEQLAPMTTRRRRAGAAVGWLRRRVVGRGDGDGVRSARTSAPRRRSRR